jgi:tetratricopeptide (TPR) repeat protein
MKKNLSIPILLIISIAFFFSGCKSTSNTPQNKSLREKREVGHLEQLESTVLLIDAAKQKMLGNIANSIILYAEAVKRDPNNSAAFFELAKIHAQQGHLRDAEIFALQATSLDPGNIFFNMVLADIYFLQGKNKEGVQVQKTMARQNPNNLNLQLSLLSSYIYSEMFGEALTVLNHIEQISGFNEDLSVQKQKLHLALGRVDLAIEEAERLISFHPDEMQYLELLAELLTEAGQLEKAYDVYHKILEENPDNAMARLLLADLYSSQEDLDKAFEELTLAFQSPELELDSKARILYTFYRLSEDDPRYLEQAFVLCELVVEMHPEEAQAYALYGDFLYRDEQLDMAREMFYTSAQLEPAEVMYWQQVLFIDSRQENYEQLLKVSEQALEYFFEHAVIYLFNGLAHLQLKNYDKAIYAFNQGKDFSLSSKELHGQFLTLLADTHYKKGDQNAAFEAYERALIVDSKNALALNNYSYYLSLRNENLEKALEMSAKANSLDPNNSAYQDTYGWIKYKMGDYQEARKWIEKAMNTSKNPGATVIEHYGDVLYKLGQKEKALYYWEKALQAERDEQDNVSEFLEMKVRDKKLYE